MSYLARAEGLVNMKNLDLAKDLKKYLEHAGDDEYQLCCILTVDRAVNQGSLGQDIPAV